MATVVKRNGSRELISFDKVLQRIAGLSSGLDVDPVRIAQAVVQGVYDGVQTHNLDELAAETAAGLSSQHPDYTFIAARIAVSNLHKKTAITITILLDTRRWNGRTCCARMEWSSNARR